jgi:hypothetical protein
MLFSAYFQGKKVEAKEALSSEKMPPEKVVLNEAKLKERIRPYIETIASVPTLLMFGVLCIPFPFDLLGVVLLPPLALAQSLHWIMYGIFWDPAEAIRNE